MNEQTCTKCGWSGMVEKCLKCGGPMKEPESLQTTEAEAPQAEAPQAAAPRKLFRQR